MTRWATSLDWLLLAVAAVYLLRPAITSKPRVLGDAGEYLLMTESLFDHGSADLRDADLRRLQDPSGRSHLDGEIAPALGSYVADGNGQAYSIHFWAYSLLCLPAKAVLRALHGNELKALQLTNAALFLLAVFVLQRRGGDPGRLFAALLLLSPAAAFVLWPHPEVFSCSLVAMSLVLWHEGRLTGATLLAALASLQGPPLVLLAALFWVEALRSRPLGASAFAPTLALAPAAWPFLFYLWHYGRPTLLPLVGAVDIGQASLGRVRELFFDLNLGMVPYLTAALLGACVAPLALLAIRRPLLPSLEIWGVLGATALLASVTVNWNHGTAGPSRYVIWMLPLVFWLFAQMVGEAVGSAQVRGAFGALALVAIVSQAAVLVGRGGLNPTMDHLRHSYLAAFVLDHEPAFYNPSTEIFAERTLGYEVPQGAIPNQQAVVYQADLECRKALVQKRLWADLLARCGAPPISPDFSRLAAANQRGAWIYVDY